MSKCPNCREDYRPGDRFCQECGSKLPAPAGVEPPAPAERCSCGSSEFDEQGFCVACGRNRGTQRSAGYAAALGPGLAAATDLGLRHRRNDDAFAINGPGTGGPGSVLVVCDGVSNSQSPDVAAAAAAKVACDFVAGHLASEAGIPGAAATLEAAVREAIRHAHDAVCAVPFNRQDSVDPPAATIVVAVVRPEQDGGRSVTVGWLGDSRVYWLGPDGGRALTRDHSWMNEVVARGEMTPEQARSHRHAHSITKCLGTENFSAPTQCPEPSVSTEQLPAGGCLLACSDGLWNYAEEPDAIVVAANGAMWSGDLVHACAKLVDFARGRGGQDNITVALAKLD